MPTNVLKSIAGAICGYLVFALTAVALGEVTGRNLHWVQPLWFIFLTTVYGMAFATLGGLLATRIAPHRGWSVIGMTGVLVAGATGSLILRWPDDKAEDHGLTVWHVADQDSRWFSPSSSSFMINYRVDNLGELLEQLRANGVEVIQGPESHENGKCET